MVFVRFAYEMSCNWCQHASAAVAARDLQLAKSMATQRITHPRCDQGGPARHHSPRVPGEGGRRLKP
ncbi:hypothetical protein PAPYR_11753 [Paratrimastix pyriformis]|uniref:Uncharacterized protein n=1 Tax=Paratrimastix pyriformis TaxID=342808 RepID=A0ABQ8U342_9EUKA|nr:hypothetical protein PAPYR_11753 [Paratrimastix pyriformis]